MSNEPETVDVQALAVIPDRDKPRAMLFAEALDQADEQRKLLARYVHGNMIQNTDYGVIPGTKKPTLLKPGAEKLVELYRCVAEYEQTAKVEQWDPPGFFHYEFKCRIKRQDGMTVAEGVGSANSRESRYMRDANRRCPTCGKEAIFKSKKDGEGFYCWRKKDGCGAQFAANDPAIAEQAVGKVAEDVYSIVNTVLKMAKKRSLVDAAISLARCSDLFTQDVEDMPEEKPRKPPPPPPPPVGDELDREITDLIRLAKESTLPDDLKAITPRYNALPNSAKGEVWPWVKEAKERLAGKGPHGTDDVPDGFGGAA